MTYQEARAFFFLKPEDIVNPSTLEGLRSNAVKRVERPFDVRDRISAMLMIEACDVLLKESKEDKE